jgi:hypothetical protein
LTLVPDLAVFTYAGRLPVPGHDPAPGGLPAEPFGPCGPTSVSGRLAFTDDQATCYQASLGGGGSTDGTWWSGEFILSPIPPGDARWIDIAPASGPGELWDSWGLSNNRTASGVSEPTGAELPHCAFGCCSRPPGPALCAG